MAMATSGAVRMGAARMPAAEGEVRAAGWKRLWRWWLRHSLMYVEVVGAQWR